MNRNPRNNTDRKKRRSLNERRIVGKTSTKSQRKNQRDKVLSDLCSDTKLNRIELREIILLLQIQIYIMLLYRAVSTPTLPILQLEFLLQAMNVNGEDMQVVFVKDCVLCSHWYDSS